MPGGRWWSLWLAAAAWVLPAGCGGEQDKAGLVVELVTDLAPGEAFVEVRTELLDGRGQSLRQVTEDAVAGQRWQWPARRVAEMLELGEGRYELRVSLRDAGGRAVLGRRYSIALRAGRVRRFLAVLSSECLGVSCPGDGDEATRTECHGGRCVAPGCVQGDEAACGAPSTCEEGVSCDTGRPGCAGQCVAGLCWAACRVADGGAAEGGTDGGNTAGGTGCTSTMDCVATSCPECQEPVCGADGSCGCGPVAEGTACRADAHACTVDRCVGGVCRHEPDTSVCGGGLYCDPVRGCVACLDDAHCDDGNDCTDDECSDGTCTNSNRSRGASCGGGYCDGAGTCLECLEDAHCVATSCPECQEPVCGADGSCGCGPVVDGTGCSCGTCSEGVCRGTWQQVAASTGHTCGVRTDGLLWCWGRNGSGQLGLGDTTNRTTTARVGSATDWQQVSANGVHTCGVRTDGSLWCWGSNGWGQLGLGDMMERHAPARVGSATDWRQVAAGYSHTCGVWTDGSLWCWGWNQFGQLGLGDTTNRTTTARVGSATDWQQVSTSKSHTCGVRMDGSLWCWGSNGQGQLGQGDSGWGTERTMPARVGSVTDWQQVSAGYSHTCGVRTDGSLWCWGGNVDGQLGLGDTTRRREPTRVGSATDWRQVGAAGGSHTCGVRTDGSLWCWGSNVDGQLGLGDAMDRLSPAEVGRPPCSP